MFVGTLGTGIGRIGHSRFEGVVADVGGVWTTFTATEPSGEGSDFVGSGTRKIYVSTTGSDANPGTQASPKLTIAAGVALLRNGKPDWLLLKKGDTWTNQRIQLDTIGGLSAAAPLLISSYGTGARPLLKTNATAFRTDRPSDFIAVVGLEFYAYTRNPSDPGFDGTDLAIDITGIQHRGSYSYFLLEDCKLSFYLDNIAIQGTSPPTGVCKIRRCVIVDSYCPTDHSQGAYIEGVGTFYAEENIWDHNGWNTAVAGQKTIFNRNLYCNSIVRAFPSIITGNIFTNSSAEAFQARGGGSISGNYCAFNTVGAEIGHSAGVDGDPPITSGAILDNVIQHANDILPGTPRGYGIVVLQASNILVQRNIMSFQNSEAVFGQGITIDANCSNVNATQNIIFNFPVEFAISNSGTSSTIAPNDIDLAGSNNNPGGTAPHEPFPSPFRDAGTYYGSIGGTPPTTAGFIAAARLQSKDNWNPTLTANAVVNYVREGFY